MTPPCFIASQWQCQDEESAQSGEVLKFCPKVDFQIPLETQLVCPFITHEAPSPPSPLTTYNVLPCGPRHSKEGSHTLCTPNTAAFQDLPDPGPWQLTCTGSKRPLTSKQRGGTEFSCQPQRYEPRRAQCPLPICGPPSKNSWQKRTMC